MHLDDKQIEHDRYNARAQLSLKNGGYAILGEDGAKGIPEELRAPYACYEAFIGQAVKSTSDVLDVCCGNGLHSLTAARLGARVTATDIAENNLNLVRLRAARAGVDIMTAVADAEHLPFADQSFDVVTCAGSLSYVDLEIFLTEVRRVLRPGGTFICVDSFNHNPVYRFNRYLHYLRGARSRSTLQRMPSRRTLTVLSSFFRDLEVRYFGLCSFLTPMLRLFVGPTRAARFSDWVDRRFSFARGWAFKIVAQGHTTNSA